MTDLQSPTLQLTRKCRIEYCVQASGGKALVKYYDYASRVPAGSAARSPGLIARVFCGLLGGPIGVVVPGQGKALPGQQLSHSVIHLCPGIFFVKPAEVTTLTQSDLTGSTAAPGLLKWINTSTFFCRNVLREMPRSGARP